MHRTKPSRIECPQAVRAAWLEPRHAVSTAGHREPSEPGSDAADRRAVFANALVRLAAHGRSAGHALPSGEPQARAAADALDGTGSDLSQALHDATRPEPQDLPVFAAE